MTSSCRRFVTERESAQVGKGGILCIVNYVWRLVCCFCCFLFEQKKKLKKKIIKKQVQSTRNRKWGTTKSKWRVNGLIEEEVRGSPEQKKVEKVAQMQHFDSGIAPHLNVFISTELSTLVNSHTYKKYCKYLRTIWTHKNYSYQILLLS